MDDGKFWLCVWFIIFLIVCASAYAYYINNTLKYENFQETVKDLSPEQKCLHICGFEFHNYLENYKFCIEKCDRISERMRECGMVD